MPHILPHLTCSTASSLQLAAASLAALPAVLWFRASFVRMPPTAFDVSPMDSMGNISRAFGRQSRWNAAAAISMAIAAALQAYLVYAPTCFNLG
jgi:hypothetical protein